MLLGEYILRRFVSIKYTNGRRSHGWPGHPNPNPNPNPTCLTLKALVDPNAPDVDPSVAPIEEEAVPGVHRVQFRVDKLDTDSGQAVCGFGVALGSRIPQVEALGGTPGDLISNTHRPIQHPQPWRPPPRRGMV